MTGSANDIPPAQLCRRIVRAAERAALATVARPSEYGDSGPWPYVSLVLTAFSLDASPLLLISDLAVHTRNLRTDPRVSLLFDGTAELDDPLTGPRVSLQGKAEAVDNPDLLARYLRRYPSAKFYAGFEDFHLFLVRPAWAHFVAGFGRIEHVEAVKLDLASVAADAFSAQESEVIRALNIDHAAMLNRIASERLGRGGTGWRVAGIDPEGIDLRRDNTLARLDFDLPASSPDAAREELFRLDDTPREV